VKINERAINLRKNTSKPRLGDSENTSKPRLGDSRLGDSENTRLGDSEKGKNT
jgi:hypothetical protein